MNDDNMPKWIARQRRKVAAAYLKRARRKLSRKYIEAIKEYNRKDSAFQLTKKPFQPFKKGGKEIDERLEKINKAQKEKKLPLYSRDIDLDWLNDLSIELGRAPISKVDIKKRTERIAARKKLEYIYAKRERAREFARKIGGKKI